MKSTALTKLPSATPGLSGVRVAQAVAAALASVDDARQKCFVAGQLMAEYKMAVGHGAFLEWRATNFPDLSDDTAERWMRASANVLKALPVDPHTIDVEAIPVSEILTRPDEELPAAARQWKQEWFDFTADKTIKECLNGIFVEGDDAHRVDRAINGKTKGGAGGDRKDFPLFVSVKLKDIASHLSHWSSYTEAQRTEVKTAFMSAITGEAHTLRKRTFRSYAWPDELCLCMREALQERLKGVKKS